MELKQKDKEILKGYAHGLQDLMRTTTGDNTCGKTYDPCEFEGNIMHSYAFDMKDGGRHHNMSEYNSIDEIKAWMLAQATAWIRSEFLDEEYDEWRDNL